jgi:hypothetical protein
MDSGEEYRPGDVLPTDDVITRGTGTYHASRPKGALK